MELRTAAPEDLGKIMELIDQAKAFLKRNGVDQWQNGYPDQTCIEEDIRKGRGYLCIQDQDVVGYVCIDFEGEPAYDTLDGKWLSIQPYVVVHRLALDASVRGRGLHPRYSKKPNGSPALRRSTASRWIRITITRS